MDRWV